MLGNTGQDRGAQVGAHADEVVQVEGAATLGLELVHELPGDAVRAEPTRKTVIPKRRSGLRPK